MIVSFQHVPVGVGKLFWWVGFEFQPNAFRNKQHGTTNSYLSSWGLITILSTASATISLYIESITPISRIRDNCDFLRILSVALSHIRIDMKNSSEIQRTSLTAYGLIPSALKCASFRICSNNNKMLLQWPQGHFALYNQVKNV